MYAIRSYYAAGIISPGHLLFLIESSTSANIRTTIIPINTVSLIIFCLLSLFIGVDYRFCSFQLKFFINCQPLNHIDELIIIGFIVYFYFLYQTIQS